MNDVLKTLASEQLKADLPEVRPGDTVRLSVRVVEGNRERLQNYEGTVLRVRGGGLCGRRRSRGSHAWSLQARCSSSRPLPPVWAAHPDKNANISEQTSSLCHKLRLTPLTFGGVCSFMCAAERIRDRSQKKRRGQMGVSGGKGA